MKYIFSILVSFFLFMEVNAQTIKDVILTMPDDVIFGLSIDQKKALCAGSAKDSVKVESALNGEITRFDMSDNYVNLQTSDVGTTQIKILPLINDTKILCVVKTICATACDSHIQFYTMDWKLLPEQNLLPKRTFDWFIKEDADHQSDDFKEAMKAVDMNPMIFDLSPNDYSLSVETDIANYISSEDYDNLNPFLKKDATVFVWDKISFKEKN